MSEAASPASGAGVIAAIQQFFADYGGDILKATYEHIYLTFFAMLIVICIALPLGVFLTRCRNKRLVSMILGLASTVQTIPSLALVGIVATALKLLSFLGAPTIGTVPGLITLIMYALLPILRNTYTGIRQVDPAVVEVARGMGMRPRQVLLQVELPLALPVIMTGIRIATVWTIGVACLASLIGAGGLGDLIVRGLRMYNVQYLLAGTVPAALMALASEWFLSFVEKLLTPEGLQGEAVQETA